MKKFSFLLFTIAAFFVFSCNNLNLRNPAGSLIVSMPDLDSRAIVQEDQTVEDYKDISYRISLYSLSDELVEEKTGEPGKPVEFSEISEGSYILKGICFSKIDGIDSGIASGYVDVVVTGGEITSVNLPLIYNRLNRIDESKSSIRYEGPLEFTQPEEIYSESELFAYIKTEISKGLSAELFFTNGWKETVHDGFVIGDVVPIIVEEEFVDDEKIGMVTRRDGADDEPLKMESGDGTGKIEGIASGDVFHFAGECTVKVVYGGTTLSEEIKIKILPIESEEPEIPGDGGQVVNPVDPKEPGESDDDTEKQPGTPGNGERNFEVSSWEALSAGIAAAPAGVETTFVLTAETYSIISGDEIQIPENKIIRIINAEGKNVEFSLSDATGPTCFFDVSGTLSIESSGDEYIVFTGKTGSTQFTIRGSAVVAENGSHVSIGNNVAFSDLLTNTTGGAALRVNLGAECNVNGYVSFSGCSVNVVGGKGGAIYNLGALRVTGKSNKENESVLFSGCKTTGENSYGGAIYTEGSTLVKNCEFQRNEADNEGGAIYVAESGCLSISYSKFSANSVYGFGTDIYFDGSQLTLSDGITYVETAGCPSFQIYTYNKIKASSALASIDKISIVLSEEKFGTYKENPLVDAEGLTREKAGKVSVKYVNGAVLSTDPYTIDLNGKIVAVDQNVGLTAANPCVNVGDLLTAITNVAAGGTVYVSGENTDSGYVFELSKTRTITKNITLKSTVDSLTIKRSSAGAYFYISNGCTLNINDSLDDKKITFTDGASGNTNNFVMGENGSLVAYNAEFDNISTGAALVDEAKFYGCSFTNISAVYGAIHVASYCSATVDGCIFSGNESTQNSGYGDIYLAKGSEDTTLTLSGTVTTDIGIYVANESCGDPEINVDGIELSSNKLNIKLTSWPEAESITLFVKNNGTFTSVGDMDSKYTFVVFPDSVSTMPTKDGNGQYMTSLDGTYKEYMVIKY